MKRLHLPSLAVVVCISTGFMACRRAEQQQQAEPSNDVAVDATPKAATPSTPATPTPQIQVGELASCEPSRDAQNAVMRVLDALDSDSDGRISKQEAYAGVDFLAGGFMFRADQNSDGTISPEEGKQLRQELSQRFPTLGVMLGSAFQGKQGDAAAKLGQLLGVDYSQPLTARELLDSAHQAVDATFALADENNDGMLTRAEAQEASLRGMQALGHTAFAAADANNDGKLSEEEFRSSLDAPAKLAFKLSDSDHNGVLSEQEAARAATQVAHRLWIPSAPGGEAASAAK